MKVSAPRIKKVARSDFWFFENLPEAKCNSSEKTPGTSCMKARIRAIKTSIPKEVKTLMF